MLSHDEIAAEVRNFLAAELGEEYRNIPGSDKLISSRLVNSIIVLKMVNHLEEKFGIEFEAHEVDQDNLDSVDLISAFVLKKKN